MLHVVNGADMTVTEETSVHSTPISCLRWNASGTRLVSADKVSIMLQFHKHPCGSKVCVLRALAPAFSSKFERTAHDLCLYLHAIIRTGFIAFVHALATVTLAHPYTCARQTCMR